MNSEQRKAGVRGWGIRVLLFCSLFTVPYPLFAQANVGGAGTASGAGTISIASSGGPITLVHHNIFQSTGNVTTAPVTLTSVTSGNLLFVAGEWCYPSTYCNAGVTTTVTIADTFGTSFTECPSPFPYHLFTSLGNQYYTSCWYGFAGGSGDDTITLTSTASVAQFNNMATEWSNAAPSSPLDAATPNATGTSAASHPSSVTTAGATTAADEVVISWIALRSQTPTADAAYTLIDRGGTTNYSTPAIEYVIGAALQSYTATFTWNSTDTDWMQAIVTFKKN